MNVMGPEISSRPSGQNYTSENTISIYIFPVAAEEIFIFFFRLNTRRRSRGINTKENRAQDWSSSAQTKQLNHHT